MSWSNPLVAIPGRWGCGSKQLTWCCQRERMSEDGRLSKKDNCATVNRMVVFFNDNVKT